jgi:hypothetical protein
MLPSFEGAPLKSKRGQYFRSKTVSTGKKYVPTDRPLTLTLSPREREYRLATLVLVNPAGQLDLLPQRGGLQQERSSRFPLPRGEG